MSIQETLIKIKPWAPWIAFGILGMVGIFLVGRISAFGAGDRGIEVVYPPLVSTNIPLYNEGSLKAPTEGSQAQKTATKTPLKPSKMPNLQAEPADWAFAASKSGKTYYPKSCKGLARVKPENRVYFKTPEQAETAGLTLSKTCTKTTP